jgi:hypothetical protein
MIFQHIEKDVRKTINNDIYVSFSGDIEVENAYISIYSLFLIPPFWVV